MIIFSPGPSNISRDESVVAAVKPLGPMLVVSNGTYGERAAAMCRYHGTAVSEIRLPCGARINPTEVEEVASEAGAASVYIVHHETTTGRLNDLEALPASARADKDRLVLVDAVSSIAGEKLDIQSWGLDAVIGSANKSRHGGFRRDALHPPGLPAYFALHAALVELLEEGVDRRIERFRQLAGTLAEGMARLGFRSLLDREAYGHTLLSYELREGFGYEALHSALKERGFVVYAAQGALASTAFRIGLVGHFGQERVHGLLSAIEEVIQA